MDKNTTALTLGGIFIALCDALGEEQATIAKQALARFAQSHNIKSADARHVWGSIAHSASLTPQEAERENAELDAEIKRPNLRLIAGGAA